MAKTKKRRKRAKNKNIENLWKKTDEIRSLWDTERKIKTVSHIIRLVFHYS